MSVHRLLDPLVFWLVDRMLYLRNRRLVKVCRKNNGRVPSIANPRSYLGLMMWRKLIDRNPLYVDFSDKLRAKDYIARTCPDLTLPKTLWQGTDVREIPPQLFESGDAWLKANHGSSFNRFCAQGAPDVPAMEAVATGWLAKVYGLKNNEWTYARIQPRLLLEASISREGIPLIEFQVRAADGGALMGSVMGLGKTPEQWHYYVDAEGKLISETFAAPEVAGHVVTMDILIVPYLRAVEFSKQLSRGCDYIRCDFFWNGTELYGSEITVFPGGGFRDITISTVFPLVLGGWDIRKSHFMTSPQQGWRKIYQSALARRWSLPEFPEA